MELAKTTRLVMASKSDKPANNQSADKSTPVLSDEVAKEQKKLSDYSDDPGRMQHIGGSKLDAFNGVILGDVARAQYSALCNGDKDARQEQIDFAAIALRGFAPKDEVEGLLAAQAVGLHNATMEAMRRAMIKEQPHQVQMNLLNAANKLSGTFARLVEVLDKRRGKGSQQNVTVKHVHVHDGGQAIVGNVTAGGGVIPQNGGQPYGQGQTIKSADAAFTSLLSQDTAGNHVPVASNAERSLSNSRRRLSRRTKGQG